MAAAGITLGITLAEELIPGVEALWNAIVQLRTKNPTLTAAQVAQMVQTMTGTIGQLDNDTLSTLAQIPAAPAPAPKVGP